MRRTGWTRALALAGTCLALAGCAAGSTTTSSSTSSASSVGLGTVPSPPSATTTADTTSTGATAQLAPTRGYATYELCQGHCAGGVPAALHRPLRLPGSDGGPCPVTIHPDGPVLPSTSTQVGFAAVTGSAWPAAEVTWVARPTYTGPVLIRGGELGGGALGFGEGRVPYSALELLDSGRVSPRVPGGGRAWTTYTRLRASGCYAYQVDGTSFSEQIVFRAVA